MISPINKISRFLFTVAGAGVSAAILFTSIPVPAQELALEEIIVTAQRREESLQEVPISLDLYTGEALKAQGFRNLEDLSKFSPSITVSNQRDVVLSVRGFGTQSNRITLMPAVPIFLDGIHFGRQEQALNAFMDIEQVELLKGPQPIHFGMSATAGAVNIQSRRPTAEWESDISATIGNFGKTEFEGGIGGPITDTLGIRMAGNYKRSDGPLKHRLTGKNYPKYDGMGGRVLLEWTPSEKFDLVGKIEYSKLDNGSDMNVGCLVDGKLSGWIRDSPLFGPTPTPDTGNGRAIFAPPPFGLAFESGIPLPERKGRDCFENAVYGEAQEGPYLEPDQRLFNEKNAGASGGGWMDIREAAKIFSTQQGPEGPGPHGIITGNVLEGNNDSSSKNALIDATYLFDNDISVNLQTAIVSSWRTANPEDCQCFFTTSATARKVWYDQWSQLVRFESPTDGYQLGEDISIDVMVGAFIQEGDLDGHLASLRSDNSNAIRYNASWEDSTWKAAFWNLDFNFLDRQFTASIGGRYSDTHKDVFVQGWAASWIFDVRPCAAAPNTDANPATCPLHAQYKQVDPSLTSFSVGPAGGTRRIDSPTILVDPATVNMNNLWTVTSTSTSIPLSWRAADVDAVGITAPNYALSTGPIGPCGHCLVNPVTDETNYDTQVVLSYTPDALDGNHTFYGKYVQAYKSGFVDIGFTSPPVSLSDLFYEPEHVTAIELGTKGMILDGRMRYDIAAFKNDFKDLQTQAAAQFFSDASNRVSLNAGKQLVKGIEFSTTALLTETLTFNLAGALMDGKMDELDGGGCTGNEIIAAAADAVNNPGGRTAAELTRANSVLTLIGAERSAHARAADIPDVLLLNGGCRLVSEVLADGTTAPVDTFNRSGDQAPRTPDWKFVYGLEYVRPLLGEYEFMFNVTGMASAGYFTGINHEREVMYDTHADVSLSAGIGDQNDTWDLVAFARNLLEAVPKYNSEYNFVQDGWATAYVSESNFTTYGVRFEYRFR